MAERISSISNDETRTKTSSVRGLYKAHLYEGVVSDKSTPASTLNSAAVGCVLPGSSKVIPRQKIKKVKMASPITGAVTRRPVRDKLDSERFFEEIRLKLVDTRVREPWKLKISAVGQPKKRSNVPTFTKKCVADNVKLKPLVLEHRTPALTKDLEEDVNEDLDKDPEISQEKLRTEFEKTFKVLNQELAKMKKMIERNSFEMNEMRQKNRQFLKNVCSIKDELQSCGKSSYQDVLQTSWDNKSGHQDAEAECNNKTDAVAETKPASSGLRWLKDTQSLASTKNYY